ncbi:MAG: tRNA uridine-5-carboxymethylaminomethyl(34) synthesis GTPase MnmE [Deltaproteobacteria bacterium RIFCSPHIGHO2_12_FULL_43_9]|nr:MAG: tRNA uridine-5-carboxymethylaminomethyl(34) synthesis GTPase MnmE [Deltaproteobacteria bacterium RIFCSPHIGHO2_12_FULL_43_9]
MGIQIEDTIAAVATPSGAGGIGIIRISGPDSLEVIKKCLTIGFDFENLKPRMLVRGKFIDEQKKLIDDLLFVWMPVGESYTGEEVVELHCHGNPFILEQVLQRLHSLGVRLAERGEFTQRAFLNGKMDLTSAEGLNDLIRAQTTKALSLAHLQHGGRLSGIFNEVRDELIKILAYLEAAIDFPNEPIEFLSSGEYLSILDPTRKRLSSLISTGKSGRLIKNGVRVVLIGDTNVGKSTILNLLIDESRVIVSDLPGTTRDAVEVEHILNGSRLLFVDTAGIRPTGDKIEILGIEHAYKQIERADILLLVQDITNLTSNEFSKDPRTINIYNKSDLKPGWQEEGGDLVVSAKEKIGIDALKEKILSKATLEIGDIEDGILTSARQIILATEANTLLDRAANSLSNSAPAEIIASDIHGAVGKLDEILGKNSTLDILDEIFGQFCIGK